MKFVFPIFLLFLYVPTYGEANICSSFLKAEVPETLTQSRKLLVGMLAEYMGDKSVLATGNYFFSTHADLLRKIESHGPVKRIVWSGELEINKSNLKPDGEIIRAINTSGFVWNHYRTATDSDEFKFLMELLRPDLISRTAEHLSFGPEVQHLDPLEGLKLNDQPLRHRVRGLLTATFSVFSPSTFGKDWKKDLNHLYSDFDPNTAAQFLFLVQSLRARGDTTFSSAHLNNAIYLFKKYIEHTLHSEAEFAELRKVINAMEREFHEVDFTPQLILLN